MGLATRDVIGIPGVEKLSASDLRAIVSVADSLDINADWLLAIEKFESNFNPKAINTASGATGAIQFMPSTAGLLGTSTAALRSMSLAAQQKYVHAYLLPHKRSLKTLEDTYLAVFFPGAIGQDDSYVVGSKDGSSFQQAIYRQNASFDKKEIGTIRRSDIVSTIRAVYNSGKGRPRVPVPGASELWRTGLILAIAGGASYGIVQWGLKRN
jgi:hypothetical protein